MNEEETEVFVVMGRSEYGRWFVDWAGNTEDAMSMHRQAVAGGPSSATYEIFKLTKVNL